MSAGAAFHPGGGVSEGLSTGGAGVAGAGEPVAAGLGAGDAVCADAAAEARSTAHAKNAIVAFKTPSK